MLFILDRTIDRAFLSNEKSTALNSVNYFECLVIARRTKPFMETFVLVLRPFLAKQSRRLLQRKHEKKTQL